MAHKPTVRIQHARNVEVLLGHVEGRVEILEGIVLAELVIVNEVGPMAMDEGAERQTVLERQMEVLDVDVLVGRRFALAPEQQALLGGHLLHGDVLDGEAQNYRPDHAEGHLQVAVNDFCDCQVVLGHNRPLDRFFSYFFFACDSKAIVLSILVRYFEFDFVLSPAVYKLYEF